MEFNKDEIQAAIDEQITAAEKKYGKGIRVVLLSIIGLLKMMNPEQTSRLIPLAKWEEYHPYPTVGALRQYHFYKDSNGFGDVVEYGGENGGTILIDENKLFQWLRNRKSIRKQLKN